MHPNQKINFKNLFTKMDPPMWVAADFECMNVPINDNDNDNDHVTDRLFINKPVVKGCNIVQNPDFENLNLEKDGYFKYSGEDCVEWFMNEILKIEGYLKNYFKNELGIILETLPKNYDQTTCWLYEEEFNLKDVKENPIVKDHCHLTGKFRGLVHNNNNLNTRRAHNFFVPIFFTTFQDKIVI